MNDSISVFLKHWKQIYPEILKYRIVVKIDANEDESAYF